MLAILLVCEMNLCNHFKRLAATAGSEKRAAEQVEIKALFHYRDKTVYGFPHFGAAAREICPLSRKIQHNGISTRHTFANSLSSAPMPTSTLHFPISTVNAYVAGVLGSAGMTTVHPFGEGNAPAVNLSQADSRGLRCQ
jgi:hypothetical protein